MKRRYLYSLAAFSIMTFASTADAQRVNPLIAPSKAPYGAVAFDKAAPADYKEAVIEGIRRNKAEIEAIANSAEAPTFENTVVALERGGSLLNESILAISNLESALGDTIYQNIMMEITPELSSHQADIILNENLWKRVKSVYDNRDSRSDLTPEDKRLLSETYMQFALNGAALEGKDREKYRKLNSELSDLVIRFGQNVSNEMKSDSRRLWLRGDQLNGLPESLKTAAREEARSALEAEGKPDDSDAYLFTVFYPSYAPFMKYQEDRELRRRLYDLNSTRNMGGEYDNTHILKDIANVRLEIANLLGHETFADYTLERTMAGNPSNVMEFLNSLREAYTEPMKREIAEMEEFARQTEGPDFKLQPWDYAFWSDKLKNAKYAFNDEDMKPYFELDNTIKGVFGLATKLYGYTFKENKKIPGYHQDVKSFEVYGPDKKLLGVLYTDFFNRPGKAPGAWMTEFRTTQKDDNGVRTIPLISIVCNFSKPVAGQKVLLTPDEVNTFLHEFGHALHGLSGQSKYPSLAGTNVYHDFVELFSQFNENYLTRKEFLDSFAKHVKTGEKIPQTLIDKFVHAEQFGAAYSCMRQLGFGFLDMAYHTIKEPLRASESVEVFENNAIDPVRVFDAIEGYSLSPSFGHIFSGGYASGYYGYKWSEELDADAFKAFKETGDVFDKATADRFHKMLESGGSVDPMELYIEFRGKKPTVDALLERDGIK
ncbi:MAG: M3 family metallopeptidase [Bacteroidales bacterium]|nr:M3 family metallopeptidase [Bacteroidales bacterium]